MSENTNTKTEHIQYGDTVEKVFNKMNNAFDRVDESIEKADNVDKALLDAKTNGVTGETHKTLGGRLDADSQLIKDLDEKMEKAVPNGGSTGQVLTKKSNKDKDATWEDLNVPKEQVKEVVEEYLIKYPVSNNIEDAVIYDLPSDMVSQPIFSSVNYVNSSLDEVLVKPALIQYGSFMMFPNTKNIDGSTEDLPTLSGTGVTSVIYRKFMWYGGKPTYEKIETIAQKGTEYIDYTGNKTQSVGGAGYSSAVSTGGYNGKVYFAFVAEGRETIKVNDAYQSLVPCCVSVTINSDTPVGEIYELTLSIEGEIGRFDLARLGYKNYYSYYTTVAPYYKSPKYYWGLSVPDGIVFCTSVDGINWSYERTYKTNFEPRYEIATAVNGSGGLIFACRAPYEVQSLYIVYIKSISSSSISKIYRTIDIGSRPCIVAVSNNFYLIHSTTSRDTCEVLQIIPNTNYDLYFYRWFSMYGNMTYYPVIVIPSTVGENNAFRSWHIVGNNGIHSKMKGISWASVNCNIDLPFTAAECVYPPISANMPGDPGGGEEEPEEIVLNKLPFNDISQMYSHDTNRIVVTENSIIINNPINTLSNYVETSPVFSYAEYKDRLIRISATIKSSSEWDTSSDWIGLYVYLLNDADLSKGASARVKYARALNITNLTTEAELYQTEFLLNDDSFTSGTGVIDGSEYLTFGLCSQNSAVISSFTVEIVSN